MKNKELNQLHEKVQLGMEASHQKMLAFKKLHNTPVVISQEGEVVRVPAEDFV